MISESRSHDLALAPTRCGSSTTDNTLPVAKNAPSFHGMFLSLSLPFSVFSSLDTRQRYLGFLRVTSSCNCDVTNTCPSTKSSTSSIPSAGVVTPAYIVAILFKDFDAATFSLRFYEYRMNPRLIDISSRRRADRRHPRVSSSHVSSFDLNYLQA